MRLGQLARKIGVRPADILDYLHKQDILLDNDSNTRVDDALAITVIQHFNPEILTNTTLEEPESIEPTAIIEEIAPEPTAPIEGEPPVLDPIESAEDQSESNEETKSEVIKAIKQELPGLKVLGKIELPKPKVKEPEPETQSTEDSPTDRTTEVSVNRDRGRNRNDRKSKRENRLQKNPVVLERERQAWKEERIKQQKAKQEKEQRTSYYQNRVKNSGPTKSARLHMEEVVELHELSIEPTTLWGKFKKWFWRK